MPRNIQDIPLNSSTLSMEEYDNFPTEVRRLLRDAPYNLSINQEQRKRNDLAEILQREIPLLVKIGALGTYGPDHPQAK